MAKPANVQTDEPHIARPAAAEDPAGELPVAAAETGQMQPTSTFIQLASMLSVDSQKCWRPAPPPRVPPPASAHPLVGLQHLFPVPHAQRELAASHASCAMPGVWKQHVDTAHTATERAAADRGWQCDITPVPAPSGVHGPQAEAPHQHAELEVVREVPVPSGVRGPQANAPDQHAEPDSEASTPAGVNGPQADAPRQHAEPEAMPEMPAPSGVRGPQADAPDEHEELEVVPEVPTQSGPRGPHADAPGQHAEAETVPEGGHIQAWEPSPQNALQVQQEDAQATQHGDGAEPEPEATLPSYRQEQSASFHLAGEASPAVTVLRAGERIGAWGLLES